MELNLFILSLLIISTTTHETLDKKTANLTLISLLQNEGSFQSLLDIPLCARPNGRRLVISKEIPKSSFASIDFKWHNIIECDAHCGLRDIYRVCFSEPIDLLRKTTKHRLLTLGCEKLESMSSQYDSKELFYLKNLAIICFPSGGP